MIHDLENVNAMFRAADEIIRERPELLSKHVDTIFNELDDGTPEMQHIRWGIMTRAKMTELTSLDNRGIIDFLQTIKDRNLLCEYIGYVLQSEYKIKLLSVLLDAYSIDVHNDIIPFVDACLEYDEECFVERIDEILDIIDATSDTYKFRFILGYANLVIKKEKEEAVLAKYLCKYSESLEQLVGQLGSELYQKRSVEAKKWLDTYIKNEAMHCKKMGIYFLDKSLFSDCHAFEEYFLLLEESFCEIQEFWEQLIPVYAQYLLTGKDRLYDDKVKQRLIGVKRGSIKDKRICLQSIQYKIKKSIEYVDILENIISVPFNRDIQILEGLDYYFDYIFSIDSVKALKMLYELYEMNEYGNGDGFLEYLPQTSVKINQSQDDIINLWWNKFMYGSKFEFKLSVEIFSKLISLKKIEYFLEHVDTSRDELICFLEGIYLFTIEEKKIANMAFVISSYIRDREFFLRYCIDNIFINYSCAMVDAARKYLDDVDMYKSSLAKDIVEYYEIYKEKIQKGYDDRDFMPPTSRKVVYHRAMAEQNKKICAHAEEQSVFANIFPTRKMKYGRRFAFIQIQRKGEFWYNVSEYAKNTFSMELPQCFINNPLKYVYMRMDYLERRGKNEINC